jgi:hypothetical protein
MTATAESLLADLVNGDGVSGHAGKRKGHPKVALEPLEHVVTRLGVEPRTPGPKVPSDEKSSESDWERRIRTDALNYTT